MPLPHECLVHLWISASAILKYWAYLLFGFRTPPHGVRQFSPRQLQDPSLDRRRCSCQNPSTDIDCDELLNQSSATTSAGSSYWVIAVAVGASIFILVASAGVAIWRRRKYGGGGGDGATRLDFRWHTKRCEIFRGREDGAVQFVYIRFRMCNVSPWQVALGAPGEMPALLACSEC